MKKGVFMALDRQDLKEIKKIIDGAIEKSEVKMSDKIAMSIEKSEFKMSDKIEFLIEKSELRLEAKIVESEKRITANISREVSDLTGVNQEIIEKTDKIDNHEKRIIHIETKLGIKSA